MRTEAVTQKTQGVNVILRDMTPESLSKLDRRTLSQLGKDAIRISTILKGLPPIIEAIPDFSMKATPFIDQDSPTIFFSPNNKPYIAMEVFLRGEKHGFLDATPNSLFAYRGEQINGERLMVLGFQGKDRTRSTVVLEATRKNLPEVLKKLISS